MNINKHIEQLIARHINGECNIDEQNEMRHWIDSSDENRKLFFQIKDTWDASLKMNDNSENALLQFYKQQATKNSNSKKVIQLWRWAASVAAVFVVALVSVFFLNSQFEDNNKLVTLKVPLGSRSEIVLADGSEVTLNSGSEISYPSTFNKKHREVSLTGEAFFKVKSDKSNPFIVKTSDFDVRVTGTQFNVCSYTDTNTSSLTLAEGKVAIQFSGNRKIVNVIPGQQLTVNRKNSKYEIAESDVDIAIAWKDGQFWFKDILFPELIKRLERWYDVKLLHSAPELKNMKYSGRFKNQETIWQVLDALKLTTPIDYEKVGNREFKIIYKPM